MIGDTFEPRTLASLFDAVVAKYPSHVAVQSPSQTDHMRIGHKSTPNSPQSLSWTFSDLRDGSIRLASRLRADGVRPGSRVAALLYNQAEWALLFWTAVRIGCQFVPLDPRVLGQPAIASHLIRSIDAAAIFVSTPEIARQIGKTLTGEGKRLPVSSYLVSSLAENELPPAGWRTLESIMVGARTESFDSSIEETHLQPSDVILILTTSGTTALPRLCPHTSITLWNASQVCRPLQLDADSSLCQQLPNFHIFGILLNLAFWLSAGRLVVPSRSFDPQATLETIASNQKVYLPCVPSMLQALKIQLSTTGDGRDTRPFAILTGGAVVTPETVAAAKLLQPEMIFVGYGATEAVVTPMHRIDEERLDRINAVVAVAQVALEKANVRVCQLGSRTPLPHGQVGEIHQGGLGVIDRYLDVRDDKDSEFYKENGVRWKAMGDQGYIDNEGRVHVLGRYDDIIIRGGENISPLSIEESLVATAEIEDAAVVGVPDPVAGEVPVAIVRQRKSGPVPVKRLQAVVTNCLGRAFSPTMILDLSADLGQDHFPTTATGKIQRKILKGLVLDHVRRLASLKRARLSSDLTKDIASSWAVVTGLAEEDIDPEASIKTFADSIMLMQFLNEAQAQGWRITREDVMVLETVHAQAEFIVSQRLGKDEPSVVTVLRG